MVASVSCIYGLGSPEEYRDRIVVAAPSGEEHEQRALLRRLVDLQYDRNDMNLVRGTFRVRGDTVEIHPAYEETAVRIELFGDTVERIVPFDVLTGEMGDELEELVVFAATHYVAGDETIQRAIGSIEAELRRAAARELEGEGKLLEAQRLRVRTEHDLEMLAETGVCSGIENYSRHLDGRGAGRDPLHPARLLPQGLPGRHRREPRRGARSCTASTPATARARTCSSSTASGCPRRSTTGRCASRSSSSGSPRCIFVSATPGPYELEVSAQVVEQVIRPTGLVDPEVVIAADQGPDRRPARRGSTTRSGDGGRVLVTTLTKKMAEDLTDYLADAGVRVQYLHSDIDTIDADRDPARACGSASIDVLVGINLLREGLDLPEVSLVAILDADKEGFLRSASSLIQTMGRAARNVDGQRGPLRRHHHRLDARGDLGDRAAPGAPDRLQRRARHRPADHPQGGDRHPGAAPGRGRRDRAGQAQPGRGAVAPRDAGHAGRGPGWPSRGRAERPRPPTSWPSSSTRSRPRCAGPPPSCASRRPPLLRDELAELAVDRRRPS